jgi:hypothetical protein
MSPRLARFLGGVIVVALAVGASAGVGAAASTSGGQQIAHAGVVQLSDFPTGWQQSARGSTSDAQLDAAAAKIPSCKPFLAFSKANKQNPRAKSPNFNLAQSNVTNTVSVYPSAAKGTAAMRTFASPKMPGCLEKIFSSAFKAQLVKDKTVAKQLESVKVDISLLSGVQIGDEAVAYEGKVDVAMKDGTVQTIGLGAISVRVGNALSGYAYTSDTDISSALQPAIVSSVTRLQDATASAS